MVMGLEFLLLGVANIALLKAHMLVARSRGPRCNGTEKWFRQ